MTASCRVAAIPAVDVAGYSRLICEGEAETEGRLLKCDITMNASLVPAVDLHSNLRLGPIRVRSGTEIETDASLGLNLSANFVALSGESGLLFDCGLPGFDDGV
jgi:hypothetical protein